nr:helix-turn-helix transcriptional regulator [uncultured Sphingorhabdus sp.]
MLEDVIYQALGARISTRRSELKLSQADLAERVGLSRGSVANVEAGRQRLPLHQVYRFLEALRLPDVSDLLPKPTHQIDDLDEAPSLDMRKATKGLSDTAKAQVMALHAEYRK